MHPNPSYWDVKRDRTIIGTQEEMEVWGVGNINRTELRRDSQCVMLLSWLHEGRGQETPTLERNELCFGLVVLW